jgi:hypothetical protein
MGSGDNGSNATPTHGATTMSFPHAGLGQVITNWVAERALSRSIRHVDDHMLRDLGLHDEFRGRAPRIASWPTNHRTR